MWSTTVPGVGSDQILAARAHGLEAAAAGAALRIESLGHRGAHHEKQQQRERFN
jgi:hypothetical protein